MRTLATVVCFLVTLWGSGIVEAASPNVPVSVAMQKSGSEATLLGVFFHDPQLGWAVGSGTAAARGRPILVVFAAAAVLMGATVALSACGRSEKAAAPKMVKTASIFAIWNFANYVHDLLHQGQRHHDVLLRGELRQQVMELVDETERAIAQGAARAVRAAGQAERAIRPCRGALGDGPRDGSTGATRRVA